MNVEGIFSWGNIYTISANIRFTGFSKLVIFCLGAFHIHPNSKANQAAQIPLTKNQPKINFLAGLIHKDSHNPKPRQREKCTLRILKAYLINSII